MNRIGFVLKGYPRLSETFIAQEIYLLEQKGFAIEIFSLREAREKERQPVHSQIKAPVTYLPEYIGEQIRDIATGWIRTFIRFPLKTIWVGLQALTSTLLKMDRSPIKRYLQATWLISKINLGSSSSVHHLHSHFAHTPTEMTYYVSKMAGLTYSISAHAKDIYTIPQSDLKRRVNSSEFIMTCTSYNYEFLQSIPGIHREKIHKVYHGIDPEIFKPTEIYPTTPTDKPVQLITIGRLVEKKGYPYILDALSILKRRGYNFTYSIFGSGEGLEQIRNQIIRLQLTDRVRLMGHATQTEIIKAFSESGIYINASVEAKNGDRDGIPNTLAEAMSMALPVVATTVSGIPELIRDKNEGFLVPPNDSTALANAIAHLIDHPTIAREMGGMGRKRVIEFFNCHHCIEKCESLLWPFSHTQKPKDSAVILKKLETTRL